MSIIYFDLWFLNGALIDALEYYLFLKKHKCDVRLVVFSNSSGCSPDLIFELVEDRYHVDFDYRSGIEILTRKSEVIKHSGKTMMIVDWGTFQSFPIIPTLWENIVIWFDYKDKEMFEKYRRVDRFDNVTIYKEMPYEYGKDYKFKFAFDLYRPRKCSRNIGYLNCFSKGKSENISLIQEKYNFDHLVITANGPEFKKLDNVVVFDKHPKDFFSLFNTYIYIHDGVYWDPRPRLFHESAFYEKKVIYINEHKIKDGGYYRYHDSLVSPIKERSLSLNDEVIQKFVS